MIGNGKDYLSLCKENGLCGGDNWCNETGYYIFKAVDWEIYYVSVDE